MEPSQTLAIWLGRGLLEAKGDLEELIVVDEVERQVTAGTSFAEAVRSVSSEGSRAGDFGMEIVGAAVGAVLLQALADFWKGYIEEIAKKLGKSVADLTVEQLQGLFRRDVKDGRRQQLVHEINKAVKKLEVEAGAADPGHSEPNPSMITESDLDGAIQS